MIFKIASLAAAAVIALLLISRIFSLQEPGLITLNGEKKELILPDRSKVTLNAASQVGYSKKSWDEKREIKLKGEAFFEVEKGSTFRVTTNSGTVEVLGTSFNVLSRDSRFEVHCRTGKVRVTIPGQEAINLEMGDKVSEADGEIVKARFDPNLAGEWMDGLFRFEGQPLSAVFAELERQYSIKTVVNEELKALRYSGSFSSGDLDKAMYEITWPMGLWYEIQGNRVIITRK